MNACCRSEYFFTYGTNLIVDTSCCIACGVTVSFNNFLFNGCIIASGAMLTCGKTGFGASGSFCFVNNDVVTESGDFFLCNGLVIASGAMLTRGKTGFGASGSFCVVNNDIVIESINCLVFCFVTYGALTGFVSCYGARRSRGLSPFAPSVTLCINDDGVSGKFRITYGAVNYVVIAAAVFAISCYFFFYNDVACGVTVCGNSNSFSRKFIAANRAVNYVVISSCVFAIGIYVVFHNGFACGVTLCGNSNSFSRKFIAANRAVNYVVISSCVFAIGIYVVFYNDFTFGVTVFINVVCFIRVATYASVSGITLIGAGRSGYSGVVSVFAYNVIVAVLNGVVAVGYLVCVFAIIGVVSGVEVLEGTTVNDDGSELFFLVDVEEVSVAVVKLISGERTAVDNYYAGSGCVDTCATTGSEGTVFDGNLCTVCSRNYASAIAVLAAFHCAVTGNGNLNACAISPKNVNNALKVGPISSDCFAVQVDGYCLSGFKLDVACQIDVGCQLNVVACIENCLEVSLVCNCNGFACVNCYLFAFASAGGNEIKYAVDHCVCFGCCVTGYGNFYLGRVIATRAGLVSFPTDFGASRSLCCVLNVSVTESTNYFRF